VLSSVEQGFNFPKINASKCHYDLIHSRWFSFDKEVVTTFSVNELKLKGKDEIVSLFYVKIP
jgi:hypothetical protein